MSAEMSDFGDYLTNTSLVLVYSHQGYMFKAPIITCKDQYNTPGLVMTGLIALAANVGAYLVFRKIKSSKQKHEKKE